jgi:hypothetical protein
VAKHTAFPSPHPRSAVFETPLPALHCLYLGGIPLDERFTVGHMQLEIGISMLSNWFGPSVRK